MWESLARHSRSAELHVLCLTPACEVILNRLGLPGVHTYSLAAMESAFPALEKVKALRTDLEYYFTLTPALPLFLLDRIPSIERITYVDGDLFFFSDPKPVFDELGEASVGIIEHRFPDTLKSLERYGRFNVGWLTFRNDERARACLRHWHEQCLEWCCLRVEDGRFADQKYLDDWPERVAGVKVLQHRGANVAPWNLGRFPLEERGDVLLVGGDPLLFFHAHGFQPECPGESEVLNLERYGVARTPILLRNIYEPYSRALASATGRVAPSLVEVLLREGRPNEVSVRAARLRAKAAERASVTLERQPKS